MFLAVAVGSGNPPVFGYVPFLAGLPWPTHHARTLLAFSSFFSFVLQLANIYSTEFVVETADARAGKQYRQVFRNNMQEKVRMHHSFVDVVVVTCFREC